MTLNWFDHLFFFIIGILIPGLSLLSEFQKSDEEQEEMDEYVKSNMPPKKKIYYSNGLILFVGAIIVLILWNLTSRPNAQLGIQYPKFNQMVLYNTIALIVIYIIDSINNFKDKEAYEEIKKLSNIMPTSWSDYKHFIFLSFAAGIGEEIMFRGFMVNYVSSISSQTGYTYLLSIMVPALLFSLSHIYQGLFAVLKILCISILFGAIYYWSESLLIVCIIHILVDLISGALLVIMFNKNKVKLL